MARKLTNEENETHTLQHLENGKKTEKKKKWNMRYTNCRTWKKARNCKKKVQNEKCTLQDLEYGEKSEIVEKEKCTLQDLQNGKRTDKRGE